MNSVSVPEGDDSAVTIVVCPDGPLLVRGPAALVDVDGTPITRERATVALCRCGGTSIAPFCDSTHKKRKPRHT
ncbi:MULTISPECIES: CDGSH iron-sulfur domain-containing protein [Rhodococcus erythropolis group]|uniref:CDGSH iron-sulfur domain-containing protein n=1 Tax=Rhodococcus erythropolis group TaxID=2840174 RepID=UPI001BE7CB44|nr:MULTISPECIES: CDGSH iron-sulfur domain-containing protein [Rhodococcus erythropolis group]MBT2269664.1 CDGSH iron-sulfur domain-containing protein [Rhodococcus erythropolis]MBT2274181.1 CDGSH iron-sulfur domain-containing protein [Rhodococcus qingshengii]